MIFRTVLLFTIFLFVSISAQAQDQCNTTQECKNMYGSAATDCANSKSDASICMCGGTFCDELEPVSPRSQDQCNTTQECKDRYGNGATDCADSRSDQSVCMCGSTPCDEDDGSDTDTDTNSECVFPNVNALYTQTGSDPSFDSLIDDGTIPQGYNSTKGVTGSVVNVNNGLLEPCSERNNGIPQTIRIHTLCNSTIGREHFPRWTRWYQEDGKTQIFRLFKGEHNVRNDRPDAARIESFSTIGWSKGDGWHKWSGTYTIIKPHECAIFQAKNSINDWGIMLNMTDDGDILLNHRRHKEDFIIAENMTGIPFDITVWDNGREYKVYLNGEFVDDGYYDRPEGKTGFRWGMYDGTITHDAMLLVTSARVTKP